MDLDDPFQRKWYIKQVLLHGRAEDLRSLDLDELARLLPELDLPGNIKPLWEDLLRKKGNPKDGPFERPSERNEGRRGILTFVQRDFLRSFSLVPDSEEFYLTGGTALAEFYLGHRFFLDLYFCTPHEGLILPFSRPLEAHLREHGWDVEVVRRFSTFVEGTAGRGKRSVRFELSLDSPFRFSEPVDTEYGVKVNSYEDIVVDKLLAFYGRTEVRDAVDLYFVLRREDPGELMEKVEKKDPGFDPYWFAVALRKVEEFPDEVERWPVEMVVDISAREVEEFLYELGTRIATELL